MKKVNQKKKLLWILLLITFIVVSSIVLYTYSNTLQNSIAKIEKKNEMQLQALTPRASYTTSDFDNQTWLTNEIAKQIGHQAPWTHAEIQTIKRLYFYIGAINPGYDIDTHIPEGIGYLIGLEEIDIYDNRLSGNLYQIATLPNLKRLRIMGCELSGSIPSFNNCPNLTIIDLDNNALTGYYNGLTGGIPEFNLPKLTNFEASNNNLSGQMPSFSGCPLIRIIDVGFNQLSGNIPEFKLPHLLTFDARKNNLSGHIPSFTNCSSLTTIFVQDNELTGNIPSVPSSVSAFYYNNNYLVTSAQNQNSLTNRSITLNRNQTHNFAYAVNGITAPFDKATSNNTSVAMVNNTTITGLEAGSAIIKYKMTGSSATGNDNATVTINVTVNPVQLTSISIKSQPSNLSYVEGQKLNLSGLIATLKYNDSTSEDITFADFANKGITVNITNGTALSLANHNKPITLTCNGKTANTSNLTVVAKSVTGILIKTQPNKLNYMEGQKLDLSGLVATLIYDNNSAEDVAFVNFASKGITVNITNGTTLSISNHNNKPITLTCNSKTVNTSNLTVLVKSVNSIVVKNQPDRLNYIEGKLLDLSGLVVTLTYNDNSSEDVVFGNFINKGITASPTNGTTLSRSNHNSKPIVLTCNGKTVNTSNLTVVAPTDLTMESSTYTIDNNSFVKNILPDTTVDSLLQNITCNYEMKVYNRNNQEITGTTLIGTGMKIISNNEEYILAVKGDTDGNTKVDLNDAIRSLQHRAGGINPQLTGAYLKAAELTTSGQVTLNDVIKIMRYKATNGESAI